MKFFILTLLLIKVLNYELKKTNLKDKSLNNISFKKKNSIDNNNEHYSQNKNSLNLNLVYNNLGNFTNFEDFQISLKRMKVTSIQSKEVLEIFIKFSYFILLTSMKIRLYKITSGKTFTIYFFYLSPNVTQT